MKAKSRIARELDHAELLAFVRCLSIVRDEATSHQDAINQLTIALAALLKEASEV